MRPPDVLEVDDAAADAGEHEPHVEPAGHDVECVESLRRERHPPTAPRGLPIALRDAVGACPLDEHDAGLPVDVAPLDREPLRRAHPGRRGEHDHRPVRSPRTLGDGMCDDDNWREGKRAGQACPTPRTSAAGGLVERAPAPEVNPHGPAPIGARSLTRHSARFSVATRLRHVDRPSPTSSAAFSSERPNSRLPSVSGRMSVRALPLRAA
jgi:hypothetical protein